jgi:CBS-domain-containing membrane protein
LSGKPDKAESSYLNNIKQAVIPSILLGITLSIFSLLMYALKDYLVMLTDSKYLIFASFGSSAFIMYLMPKSPSAATSKFVKSYMAASLIGYGGLFLSDSMGVFASIAIVETLIAITLVGIRAEHPPAAAIGLVFTIYRVGFAGVLVIIVGIIVISLLTLLMKKTLRAAEDEEKTILGRVGAKFK